MKKSNSKKRKSVEFILRAGPGKNIFVAGAFNGWNPTKEQLKNKEVGLYAVTLHLLPGIHEYKFVVDDIWQTDPENPVMVKNTFGSMNSVVTL